MQMDIIDSNAKKVRNVELKDEIFKTKVNEILINEAVVSEHANKRPGTVLLKNRSMVKMANSKIYRQKGTGYARHGAKSANLFVGGGAAFGGQTHVYKKKMPRRKKSLALRSMISWKVQAGKFLVLDSFGVKDGRTKELAACVSKVRGAVKAKSGRSLLIIDKNNGLLRRASGNIASVLTVDYRQLNMLSLYQTDLVLTDSETLDKINSLKWE